MTISGFCGRRFWTAEGKDNCSPVYEYIAGQPLDGSSPEKDENYLSVNLGVRAIQNGINSLGYSPTLVDDGVMGSKTRRGLSWAQNKLSLRADGKADMAACRSLWRSIVAQSSLHHCVQAKYVWGILMFESAGDPGAVDSHITGSRGLAQINLIDHLNVSLEQAHDAFFSIDWTAERFRAAWLKFSDKPELVASCAIANHRSSLDAESWYLSGAPSSEKVASYVSRTIDFSYGW